MAEVEVFNDNLFCFGCRQKMVELVPYIAYQCWCGLRCTDPVVEAQIMNGWRLCPECTGDKCESCDWLGVLLPIPRGSDSNG